MSQRYSVLFVCLGNICRSPLAEGIFRKLAEDRGLGARFLIDSCGTGSWHAGSPPHPESVKIAHKNGIDITGQRARQVQARDFKNFNLLVAMDRENRDFLEANCSNSMCRIVCLREFDPPAKDLDVPDPYHGGPE